MCKNSFYMTFTIAFTPMSGNNLLQGIIRNTLRRPVHSISSFVRVHLLSCLLLNAGDADHTLNVYKVNCMATIPKF